MFTSPLPIVLDVSTGKLHVLQIDGSTISLLDIIDGAETIYHNHTGVYAPFSHAHPSVDLSDSTSLGRSLLAVANAAAIRTAAALGDSSTRNVGTGSGDVAQGNSVALHEAAGDPHPQYALDSDLSSHAAASDPHTGYQKESEKGAANGYAGLGAGGLVPIAQLASGSPSGAKFIRDDGTLAVPAGGGGSFSATQVTLNLQYPAKLDHVINVIDSAVTSADKIIATLAGSADNTLNESNMTDLLQLVGQPKTGSIDFKLSFLTPAAGPFLVNYARSA